MLFFYQVYYTYIPKQAYHNLIDIKNTHSLCCVYFFLKVRESITQRLLNFLNFLELVCHLEVVIAVDDVH